jgi:hypothetical protein
LTLDCPIYKKKLVLGSESTTPFEYESKLIFLDDFAIQTVDENDIAPVAYLKINNFHLEEKFGVIQLEEKPEIFEIEPEYRFEIPDSIAKK